MKKNILYGFIVLLTWIMMVPTYATVKLPEKIRVGLWGNFSGLSAVNELVIKNQNLHIGTKVNEQFSSFATFSSFNGFIVTKQQGKILRLKENFITKEKAEEKRKLLFEKNINSIIGVDPTIGWYVYFIYHANPEEAQKALLEVQVEDATEIQDLSMIGLKLLDGNKNVVLLYYSTKNLPFQVKSADAENIPLIKLNSTYRGVLEIRRFFASDLTVINELPFEEYLYGVLPKEIPSSWPAESLKAQALAARSYSARRALSKDPRFSAYEFDVCRTIYSQVYEGAGGEQPSTNKAVDETKGQIVIYNGAIADTMFFASSGGHTQDAKYLYNDLPYLKGVPEATGYIEPTANVWEEKRTPQDIKNALISRNIDIGDIVDIKVVEYNPSGRMQKVVIEGTKGIYEINGKSESGKPTIRSFFNLKDTVAIIEKQGGQALAKVITPSGTKELGSTISVQTTTGQTLLQESSLKVISNSGVQNLQKKASVLSYTIKGKGNGHGIGMSQYGARHMATKGYNYEQIIKHYYTGVSIQK